MKILLVNAYLRNSGDAALSSALIEQLRRVWPKADIVVASTEDPAGWPTFEKCANVGSIRLYAGLVHGNKIHRLLRKALVMGVEVSWPRLPKAWRPVVTRWLPGMVRSELRELEAADLVISTAGGYLSGADSLDGDLSVHYILLPMKLAAKIGKPFALAPQSYGAFGNQRQEKAVREVLNRAECIMTREGKSFDLLHSIGVKEELLVRGVDVAFAFDPRLEAKLSAHAKKTPIRVGITTRSWSSAAKQQSYETALAGFANTLQDRYGAEVVLISHVTRDVYSNDGSAVDHSIADLANRSGGHVAVVETDPNPHEMKKLYDKLDFIVGTRFHSVIFSLTSLVPAIAIEYQHKTSGIMLDLGLSEWVINFDDVTTEKLLKLFEQLQREQTAYRARLKQVLPPYVTQAGEAGEIIKRAYDQKLPAVGDARNQAQ